MFSISMSSTKNLPKPSNPLGRGALNPDPIINLLRHPREVGTAPRFQVINSALG
jgi:hypothetical protein